GLAVDQSPNVMIEEGHNVTLNCSQKGTSYNGMYWYRQLPGQHLELIVHYYVQLKTMGPEFEGRFLSERKDSSLYLTVQELKSADSAVYFCAKQETQNAFSISLASLPVASKNTSNTFLSSIRGVKFQQVTTPSIAWNKTGESAEIRCEHQRGADYSTMYWFRQLPGEKIQLIVYSFVGGDPDFGKFSKEKYDVKKTEAQKGSFTVKNLEPGDTATYFCA
uniref:Ig-like domain-containing protein n=1 Tax=Lepisosteus oculatus TaxID=7918 RepID=W5N7B6_LEPOC